MIAKSDKLTSFIADLPELNRGNSSPAWVKNFRDQGAKRFNELGIPTVKDEEWKYTDLAAIAGRQFRFPQKQEIAECNELTSCRDPKDINLVFLNGVFSKQFSNLDNLPKGVTVTDLATGLVEHEAYIKKILEEHNLQNADAFVALNSALMNEGAFIKIDDNVVLERIIHILNINCASDDHIIIAPKNLISLGKSAQAEVLESYVSFSLLNYFTNAVTDIFLAPNATLRYCKAQAESAQAYHIGTTRAWQKRDSNFESFSMALGAALSRHNLNIVLEETGANAILNGLYTLRNNQVADNHTLVDHRPPNCTSNQLYKGILNDSSHAIFNGKIFVHREAQQTNSYQLNKNLLLGNNCRVDTKPQLEIFADDVKCTHGATIGQLNEEEVFYLESRAIPKDLAVKMLARGFIDDIINRIPNPSIREKLNGLLSRSFEVFQ